MQAYVVRAAGGPEVLELTEVPQPAVADGWVLIRVRAFGINRSEIVTRSSPSGHGVTFPRVLGLECAGEVVAAPGDSDLEPGRCVIAVMGGMGKDFDGGYAEYVAVPASAAIPIETTLSWSELASVPMAFGTAWGSVIQTLGLRGGQSILIRAATSSVGMAAISLARGHGATVIATTRSPEKVDRLTKQGADVVVADDGSIAAAVREFGAVSVALDLIGPSTAPDTQQAVEPRGVVCVTGFLGESWDFDAIPRSPQHVRIARFKSGVLNRATFGPVFQRIVEGIESGVFPLGIDRTFAFADLPAAHHVMAANQAAGKLVVEIL